jgi:hypothetical protein
MVLSIVLSFIAGLEGLICIAMALAPLLLGTLAGGVLYVIFLRWQQQNNTLNIVTLPICAILLLGANHVPPKTYTISNDIMIDASPKVVFNMLKTIPEISPDEIPTRASHLLGIPKPTAATWVQDENGIVRHSYWGDDVHFREKITTVEENKRIEWDFSFPDGWVAEGIQDPHITVGGRYFDILSGEYSLENINGKTRLSLTTQTYDNSGLGLYAKFWHHFFFEDFHQVILHLVKTRTEAQT